MKQTYKFGLPSLLNCLLGGKFIRIDSTTSFRYLAFIADLVRRWFSHVPMRTHEFGENVCELISKMIELEEYSIITGVPKNKTFKKTLLQIFVHLYD